MTDIEPPEWIDGQRGYVGDASSERPTGTNWNNNAIQYPRLIAEAEAAGAFTVARIADMAMSMDLFVEEVNHLIQRACETWDAIVAVTPRGPFPVTTWPPQPAASQLQQNAESVRQRLEYLRGEIRAERISYGEIAELQSLADFIDADDLELLHWAEDDTSSDPPEPPTASALRDALAAVGVAGFGDCVDDDSIIEAAARAYLARLEST